MDRSVEKVSRLRVVLAPISQAKKEVEEILKLLAIDGEISKHPTKEVKMEDIIANDDEEE